MTSPTYEELVELNRGLANQVVRMSDTLQASARQIAADAWDMGYESGFDDAHWSRDPREPDAPNPYRQLVETFGDDN